MDDEYIDHVALVRMACKQREKESQRIKEEFLKNHSWFSEYEDLKKDFKDSMRELQAAKDTRYNAFVKLIADYEKRLAVVEIGFRDVLTLFDMKIEQLNNRIKELEDGKT